MYPILLTIMVRINDNVSSIHNIVFCRYDLENVMIIINWNRSGAMKYDAQPGEQELKDMTLTRLRLNKYSTFSFIGKIGYFLFRWDKGFLFHLSVKDQ